MAMDIQKTLSLLQMHGLTQAQIASEIGCSQPNVCDMASGKVGKKRPAYQIVVGLTNLALKHGIGLDQLGHQAKFSAAASDPISTTASHSVPEAQG